MGAYGFPQGVWSEGDALVPIPSYRFPESAVRALERAVAYGQWLRVAESPIPDVSIDPDIAIPTVDGMPRAARRRFRNLTGSRPQRSIACSRPMAICTPPFALATSAGRRSVAR